MLKKSHLTAHGKALWKAHQGGGGWWGSFVDKLKNAGRTVYDKAIKPAYQFVRDKPLTTIATASRLVPGLAPLSSALSTAATLTGKGKKRKSTKRKQKGGSSKAISFKGLPK